MRLWLAVTASLLTPTRCAHTHSISCPANINVACTSSVTFVLFYSRRKKHLRTHHDISNSKIVAAAITAGYDRSGDDYIKTPRQLVIFRAPSRHTYGLVRKHANYDLPAVELRNLLSSMSVYEEHDIQFNSVQSSSSQQANGHSMQRRSQPREEEQKKPKSRNQSKKKRARNNPNNVQQLLFWLEKNDNGIIPASVITKAASRAILTHATFSIYESMSFSEDDWKGGATTTIRCCSKLYSDEILEKIDVIDMTNTNMSRQARAELIERASCLIEMHSLELKLWLQKCYNPNGDLQPIIIHHTITPTQRSDQPGEQHFLHFGYLTSIGPAGTRGAPSQTLRRTHRGVLKQYALKNRKVSTADTAHVTSTAMEPEIGFLMANLAMTGINNQEQVSTRVLDPCCGSGRLLLYAAALGATELIGVDSDTNVWKDAEREFQQHVSTIDGRPLASPKFFHGDVQNPLVTEALCTPNSVHAIVCDPPYNIGAPALVDGGKDIRPRNYHDKNNDERELYDSGSQMNKGSASGVISTDLVPSILAIARKVLVNDGRIVFFLPVRGEEMSLSLEDLLVSRGWEKGLESADCLQILKESSRIQIFSPTFARWLVCMQKR